MNYFGNSPQFGDFPAAQLTGNGGSVYTLPFKLPNENAALLFLNGAPQLPGVHFTIAEDVLTFAKNVATGVQIYVHGLGIGKALIAPSAGSVGLAQLLAEVYANASEAQGWSNTIKLLSPAGLRDAFKGANQALSASGYQKLPGGLIIQWGTGTTPAGGNIGTFTFPISFPTAALSIAESVIAGSSSNLDGIEIVSFTASQFQAGGVIAPSTGAVVSFRYIAIGY